MYSVADENAGGVDEEDDEEDEDEEDEEDEEVCARLKAATPSWMRRWSTTSRSPATNPCVAKSCRLLFSPSAALAAIVDWSAEIGAEAATKRAEAAPVLLSTRWSFFRDFAPFSAPSEAGLRIGSFAPPEDADAPTTDSAAQGKEEASQVPVP